MLAAIMVKMSTTSDFKESGRRVKALRNSTYLCCSLGSNLGSYTLSEREDAFCLWGYLDQVTFLDKAAKAQSVCDMPRVPQPDGDRIQTGVQPYIRQSRTTVLSAGPGTG